MPIPVTNRTIHFASCFGNTALPDFVYSYAVLHLYEFCNGPMQIYTFCNLTFAQNSRVALYVKRRKTVLANFVKFCIKSLLNFHALLVLNE